MGFLLVLMVAGLSVLAGGQVWAFTGSTPLAIASGSLVMVGLAWCYWRYFRNRRGARFVGEVHQQVDESEFTVLAPGQFDARERVQANADLGRADLSGADLQGANLCGVELRKAQFGQAQIQGADLMDADLRGVDLRDVIGLTKDQIEEANTDEKTLLPEELEA